MAQAQAPLIPFHPNMKHTDRERFICIYPAYVDSGKSVQEGRKMPREYCVESPTYQEIKDVLLAANMNVVIENKIYPRERSKEILQRGRVRVQLKQENGAPINPELATRTQIMKYIGQKIPQLKSRTNAKAVEPQPQGSSNQQQGGGKKNKGKRR